MEGTKGLSPDEIAAVLAGSPQKKGPVTEPRNIATWYSLDHLYRPAGCSNPDCVDNRSSNDIGRNVVIKLGDNYICRFCFLDGYLSNVK